jgi:hypothetical protein
MTTTHQGDIRPTYPTTSTCLDDALTVASASTCLLEDVLLGKLKADPDTLKTIADGFHQAADLIGGGRHD